MTTTTAQADSGDNSLEEGEVTVARLHRQWVFGWERGPDDGPWRFQDTFGDYYDFSSADVVLYDDFDPEHRVARSAAQYGANWEPSFNALRSARHVIADGPQIVRSDGLAASRLVFLANLETLDGTVTGIRTTTSLVWRRTDDAWRIVREHNSTVVIPVEEVEAALSAASEQDPILG